MSDSVVTLAELRRHGAALRGQDRETWDQLWDYVEELRRDLDDTRARLQRRTDNVRTLATVIRQLAEHVSFPLMEAPSGSDVQTPVPEPEPS